MLYAATFRGSPPLRNPAGVHRGHAARSIAGNGRHV